ncbi:MAG: glycosyltransferase family 39 protein, partial [Gaiellaceae bacterium]
MSQRVKTGRAAQTGVIAVAATMLALLGSSAFALVVSFASYSRVKRRLDAFASDHHASLSRHRFAVATWELRAVAVVLLLAVGAIYIGRGRLAEAIARLAASVARSVSQSWLAVRTTIRLESRVHIGALALIVLAAVLVRLDFLFQPMRYDESGTYVHYASEPFYIGLSAYTAPNNHLFHTLLVHISTVLFGNAPWAIRLPAFVAGVLVVPAAYLAGRLLYGRHTALVAAALVAASSRLVEYSTNARGYTMLTLAFVLMLALATVLARSDEPAGWLAFSILAALGLWTVPTMLYAIALVVAWLAATILVERKRIRTLTTRLAPALAGAALLTLALYAPAIVASGPHALLQNDFVRPRGLVSTARALPRSLWETFAGWQRDLPLAVAVILGLGVVVAVVQHRRVSTFRIAPALATIVVLPIVIAQRVVPYDRVWLFLLPLYLITASAGLVGLARRMRTVLRLPAALATVTVAAVSVACGVGLSARDASTRAVYFSEDTSTFRDAPRVASFLEHTLRPGDRVLVSPPGDLILEYYLGTAGLDTGRLLYTDFRATRLFAVVKEGPREYPLPEVIRQHLSPRESRGVRPIPIRRYPHS